MGQYAGFSGPFLPTGTVLMKTLQLAPAVLLLAVGLATAAPVPTVSDDQLKERAAKLNDLTTTEAMDAKLKEVLKDRDLARRLVKVAAAMHDEAKGKDKPFKFNAALVLGKAAQVTKEYAAAKTFYTFCEEAAVKLDSEPKLAQSMEALIDLAWDQKDYDGVIKRCTKALESGGEGKEMQTLQVFAIEKMIQAKAKKGEVDDALAMVDRAPFKAWYLSQLKSFILREAGKYDEAVEALEAAGKAVEDDQFDNDDQKQRLLRNVKYMTANIHVEAKKIDKAADILKGLMKDDPDNPTYPNDLGFIWVDNDMNVDEAEKLVRKALELDEKMRKKLLEEKKIDEETAKKRTASYVDSLGWVLFKQKKYEEAKKALLEAAADQDEAEHIEIWDHLADVQFALGDVKGAIETWTKALKFDDLSKRDAERRKKVTKKLTEAKKSLDGKKDDKPDDKKDK
jgi:tetratricopeptide (TPR) repeat protein